MGCGASKASSARAGGSKYISEPAPEKFTPPSRVELSSSWEEGDAGRCRRLARRVAFEEAATSTSQGADRRRREFRDDILGDFDDAAENFVDEEGGRASTASSPGARNFADDERCSGRIRCSSGARSRRRAASNVVASGLSCQPFRDTGRPSRSSCPTPLERNSRVSSEEAADEAAAEIANGGSQGGSSASVKAPASPSTRCKRLRRVRRPSARVMISGTPPSSTTRGSALTHVPEP